MSESNKAPTFVSYKKTKVTSLGDLKRGDHVAFKRCGGIYCHHGIVTKVLGKNELEVIHNTVADGGKAANGGDKCKIQQEKVKVYLRKEDLYRCNYKPGECLEPDDVIAKAESLLGEMNYNLFKSNCEHFATDCKTLRPFSNQVASFVDGFRGACSVAAMGAVNRTTSALKKYALGKVLLTTAKSTIRLTETGIKGIGIVGTVASNLAVEGIVFGVKMRNAYKEWTTGDIGGRGFWGKTLEAGWSLGTRCAFSIFGGLAGQALTPIIPFVGGLIGCAVTAVGAVAGHLLGKLGRWCCNKWF